MKIKLLTVPFILSLGLSACQDDLIVSQDQKSLSGVSEQNMKIGVPVKFDRVQFAKNIEKYLDGRVVGYGYSIYETGVEYFLSNGGGGYARKPVVETDFKFHTNDTRQEIGTLTQFVTALAVMKSLEKYKVPLNTKVVDYLPLCLAWNPSKEFKSLTFERLLTHKTGLIQYQTLYDLKKSVEGPVNLQVYQSGSRLETNVNYQLLAIILPYFEAKEQSKLGNQTKLKVLSNNNLDALFSLLANEFHIIVSINVFEPAGLLNPENIKWKAWEQTGYISADKGTLSYANLVGSEKGIAKVDNQLMSGATGLYISASEFSKILSAYSQAKIVSTTSINDIRSKLIGLDSKLTGSDGKQYYFKKGLAPNSESVLFDFGPVQLAVFTNSATGQITNPEVMASRYEQSFFPL